MNPSIPSLENMDDAIGAAAYGVELQHREEAALESPTKGWLGNRPGVCLAIGFVAGIALGIMHKRMMA